MANTTVKITKRDRYEEIKSLCERVGEAEGIDIEGIIAFCDKEMETLDARAEKARERAAEKRAAGDELLEAVFGALTDDLATRDEIAARIDPVFEASVAKVGFRLTTLVKEGRAVREEINVTKEDGKAHRVSGYKLA